MYMYTSVKYEKEKSVFASKPIRPPYPRPPLTDRLSHAKRPRPVLPEFVFRSTGRSEKKIIEIQNITTVPQTRAPGGYSVFENSILKSLVAESERKMDGSFLLLVYFTS